MSTDPDRTIVLACQESPPSGFEGVFRELYELYKDRVYNVCYRITGNPADALDASQETFGILFRKVSGFRFESRFSSWVYRIAVNASIDLKRRASNRRQASLEMLQGGADGEGHSLQFTDEQTEAPQSAASRHELEDEIQAAITRLSPKMRTITVLCYLESLSYEEISETLGVSLGTVKSRLSRAHDALDRELTPVLDRHLLS